GTISTMLDFFVAFAVMVVLLMLYGIWPGWPLLLLPVWIALLLCLSLGAGLIAAALTVNYRDVQHILPILVPFMLYASPVAYDASKLPMQYQSAFFVLNPLAAVIEGFRWSLLGTALPEFRFLAWSASFAV